MWSFIDLGGEESGVGYRNFFLNEGFSNKCLHMQSHSTVSTLKNVQDAPNKPSNVCLRHWSTCSGKMSHWAGGTCLTY